MTREELIRTVERTHPQLGREEASIVVQTLFSSMKEALVHGEKVEIRGFGSFKIHMHKAREGRNPKTGEQVFITSRRTLLFRTGKALNERIQRDRTFGE
ncbi:HU family DNA-binding protein [Thermodesulfobacteriota bacterium]